MVILNYYRIFLGSSSRKHTKVVSIDNGADDDHKHHSHGNTDEHNSHDSQDGTDNLDFDLDTLDNIMESNTEEYYHLDHLKNTTDSMETSIENLASAHNSSTNPTNSNNNANSPIIPNPTVANPEVPAHVDATADNSKDNVGAQDETDNYEKALEEKFNSFKSDVNKKGNRV